MAEYVCIPPAPLQCGQVAGGETAPMSCAGQEPRSARALPGQ